MNISGEQGPNAETGGMQLNHKERKKKKTLRAFFVGPSSSQLQLYNISTIRITPAISMIQYYMIGNTRPIEQATTIRCLDKHSTHTASLSNLSSDPPKFPKLLRVSALFWFRPLLHIAWNLI